MAENEQLEFEPAVILDFIHDYIPDSKNVTIKDLRMPTPMFVQTIYVKILLELGLDESIVNPQQASFDLLQDVGEHTEIYKTMLQAISLQAACVNVLTTLNGDTSFGLSDLLDPHPKRTIRFLSCLQNFWLFCNSTYSQVDEVMNEKDKHISTRNDLKQKYEDYRNKINRLKCKAAEDAEAVKSAEDENENLRQILNDLFQKKKNLEDCSNMVKAQMEEEAKRIAEMEETIEKLKTEKLNLHGIVDGEAAIEKLVEESEGLREHLSAKGRQKLQQEKLLQSQDQALSVLKSILEIAELTANEKKEIKNFDSKIQEINTRISKINMETDEYGSLLNDEEVQVKEKNEVLTKMKSQWSRRCQGKQEDLNRVVAELEEAKSSFDEEQLKALELSNQVKELNSQSDKEKRESFVNAGDVRSQYSKILQSIEKFNMKMASDMEKLNAVSQKLNNGAAAL